MHMDLRRMSLGQLAQLLQQISRELAGRERRPQGGGGPGGNFNTYSNAGAYGYGGSPVSNPYGNAQPPVGGGGGGGGFQKHPHKHRRPFQGRRPDYPGGSRGSDFNPGNEGGGQPPRQD